MLIRRAWPRPEGRTDAAAEAEITVVQALITAVRNMRAEMNLAPGARVRVVARAAGDAAAALEGGRALIESLARVEPLEISAEAVKPPKSASAVAEGVEIHLPLEGLIDLDAERQRLEKKATEVSNGLDGIDRKLGNEGFVSRAPAEVVEAERERRTRLAAELEAVQRNLAALADES
jgi:valyl-tRNA synthetase